MRMDNFWIVLQCMSVFGTSYVGFLQADHIKSIINHPILLPYKNKIPLRSNHLLNEDNFCRLTGSVLGGFVGYHFCPATLILSLPFIEEAWRGRGGRGGGESGGNVPGNPGNENWNSWITRRVTGWF